jgi:hypothetical protein
MQGIPFTSYESLQQASESNVDRACGSRPRSLTNEASQMVGRPAKKRGVQWTLELLNAKIFELERTVGLKAVDK